MSEFIKVAFFGMDERCAERMRTVFKMVYKGQCVNTDFDEAHVALVDMDDKNPQDAWSLFRSKYSSIPAIIMSSTPVDIEGTPFVAKPAKLPLLLDELKRVSKIEPGSTLQSTVAKKATLGAASSLEKRSQVAEKAVSPRQHGLADKNVFYHPEKFLQGKVQSAFDRAISSNETVFVRCWSDRWIVIYPESKLVLENLKESHLRNLGLVQMTDEVVFRMSGFGEDELKLLAESPSSEVKARPYKRFLWDLTVRTSRGRLVEGIDPDAYCYLDRWPNLTRLAKIPNAMRIAAFWVGNPQSLTNISSKLNVPKEHVYTFFSAAEAIGIAGQAKRKEDSVVIPEVQKKDEKKRGLFSAIMRRLGNQYDEEASVTNDEHVA